MLSSKINILAELERLDRKYTFTGGDEVRCACSYPEHEDSSPSCSINTETGQFYCHVCKRGSDFVQYIANLLKRPRGLIIADLSLRYDISTEPTVRPELIEKYHQSIWKAEPLLKELRKRAVTDDMIRFHRLGENDGRITIPIKNASGFFVNVRRYLPGAAGAEKMKNLKGRGNKPRLFPIDQLRHDEIAVCGGEIKAIVAAGQLNDHGVGCLSPTAGEHNWDGTFTEALRGKRKVWIIYDVDETGLAAAKEIASELYQAVGWVGIVALPLDPDQFPHGDINDFVHEGGQLWPLLETCPAWKPPEHKAVDDGEEPVDVSLTAAYSSENTGRRIRVEATVSALDMKTTYVIPKVVRPDCDRQQDYCGLCPVFVRRDTSWTLSKEDPALLEFIGEHKKEQRGAIMGSLGVPGQCPSVTFEVEDYYQADDVRVSPKLDIMSTDSGRSFQRVICVKEGLQLNENYRFVGRQHPHPRDHSATLLASNYEPVGDALSHYKANDGERLKKFQPPQWTLDSLRTHLSGLYADFEYNVTRIIQRKGMHLMMDVCWHSPLFMTFDGRKEKAYTEVLVVGDSAQGKSETAARLMAHYGVGTKVECKNATPAGLLGGLSQVGGKWFVSWGIIPTHDRRLVVLEELKGAKVEVIAKLTDMRSSGVAEMPKIEKQRTYSRTRLCALSNPRSERPISSYNFGIEAVRELIGSPEDTRRFDAVMIVSKDEVDPEIINRHRSEWTPVPVMFDAESCHELILWCWTRPPEKVTFERDAETAVLTLATTMCQRFSNEIPVVDTASMRFKLARVAAAIAGRTYSTNGDPETLLVRRCHAEFAAEFLTNTYASPAFGYDDFTKASRTIRQMTDAEAVEKRVRNLPNSRDFVENILSTTRFNQQDFRDWSGIDREEADTLISLLVRKRAISRDGRLYVKSPDFIDLLKRLSKSDLPDVPPHLRDGEF